MAVLLASSHWREPGLPEISHLLLDATYIKVRIDSSVRDCALLVGIGIRRHNGNRMILGTSVALSEAEVHWRTFLSSLRERGIAPPADDEDLLAAIDSGHVAGATLDVFRTEPLPAGHAFWTHPRITVTPHTSARTLRDESIAQIAGKIRALQRGQTSAGVVDVARGY